MPKEPTGVLEAVTPNGTRLYYQEKPKRLYRIGKPLVPGLTSPPMTQVPSVTTVLDILGNPGLTWWGMKVGVAGVHKLARLDKTAMREAFATAPLTTVDENPLVRLLTDKGTGLLTKHKLTTNHVRDDASARGLDTHWVLEYLIAHGKAPTEREDGEAIDRAHEGYYSAVYDAWIDARWEDCVVERMVGSLKHKFAGRYDLEASFPEGGSVLVTDAEEDVTERFFGRWRIDLKTSKGVYVKHFLQMEAYEGGSVECGYAPTDGRAVLHVFADGRYEFVPNRDGWDLEDYLSVKRAYDRLKKKGYK